ncbi:MAG: nucleotide exchange factor GrpE [Candidatus Obscuribacterales bacterium]|nr:nucleotide exchange factor GrpE [Candidatus Obscuribacterales bacterium]
MADEQNNTQASAANAGNEEKSSRMDAAKAFFRAMYAGEEAPADESTGEEGLDSRQLKEFAQALATAEQKATEAEGLYKRMAADFENFRRRVEREREEYANVGSRRTLEALMPALDDLDRAMAYLSPEVPVDKVIESLQLVATRIFSCLEQAGLKRIDTKGALFDPRFHEPVQQIETTEFPDGAITQELRGGYLLADKVVRPALVNVASNSSEPQAPVTTEIEETEALAEASAKKVKAAPNEDKVYDLGDPEDLGI